MPQPDDAETPATHVVVVVVRTGGIAGMRRQWRAEPPPSDAPHWIALIDECPWDDPHPAERGADRYVWRITATGDGVDEREAELPDSSLDGPWRALVDEVRDAARPANPRAGR